MSVVHKNLTGADLHEPKGADTALSGQVYVANGSGSGVWVDAASVITNTAFTTGDLKPTHKTAADSGWILWSDGTIGDSSSSATIRANADTSALFTFYWNNYSNALCPVSSGRGASAAADFAAHKRLSIPVAAGRVLGLAGTGSGLTARTLGDGSVGSETVTLTRANLPNTAVSVTITDPGHSHTVPVNISFGASGSSFGIAGQVSSQASSVATTGITASFNLNGAVTQTNVNIVQPSAFVNVMIKL